MNSLWDFDSDMEKKKTFSTTLETFKREIYKGVHACVRACVYIQLSRLKFPKWLQMAQLSVTYSFPITGTSLSHVTKGAERLRPLRRGVREPKTTSEMGPLSQVLGTSGVGNGWS